MKISLVIPTRERAQYAKYCVEAATHIDDKNFEIVVSDNASSDGTKEAIAAVSDPRIKYVNTGKRVSMRANFENGLNHATGDYIIFLGDDDGILVSGYRILRNLLETKRPDALSWRLLFYQWMLEYPNPVSGILNIPASSVYGQLERRHSQTLLKRFAAGKLLHYKHGANIYQGCVSRKLIEKVRTISGTYLDSHIPDVYTGIANLTQTDNYLWLRHPICIAGISGASTGAATISNEDRAANAARKAATSFVGEVEADKVEPRIDVRMRSIKALILAEVEAVNRIFLDNRLAIDFPTWFRAIVKELNRYDIEEREISLNILQGFAKRVGAADNLEKIIAHNTPPETLKPDPVHSGLLGKKGNHAGQFKIRADFRERPRQDISEVCQLCDEILRSNYMPYNMTMPLSLRGFPPILPREIYHWQKARNRAKAIFDQ